MTHRRVVVLLCVVAAVLVAPATVAQESPTPTANTTNESDGADMGTQLTAFLQSSSAAANDSVEDGMWNARFERANASQRAGLVTNRTGSLERRLEQLRDRNESIQAAYANGSLSQPAYIAQQSRLTARISALRAAINDTDTAAGEAGVNDSRLETLRQNASELTGPQVATVASGLDNGPPASAGPPGNGTAGPSSNAGPPGNGTAGPPDGVGSSGNETAAGSPGNGTGPPGNQSSNAGGTEANETEGSGGDGNGGASAGPPDGDAPGAGGASDDGNGSGGANGEQGNGSGEGPADGSGTGESGEAGSDDRNGGTNSGAGNGSGSENGNSGSSGAEGGNGSGSENGDNGGSGSGGAGDGNPGNGGPP